MKFTIHDFSNLTKILTFIFLIQFKDKIHYFFIDLSSSTIPRDFFYTEEIFRNLKLENKLFEGSEIE